MNESLEKIKQTAEERMQKTITALKEEFLKIRTSRAHPSLLEHIKVPCYDNEMPLHQIASVASSDQSLLISPWDKNLIPAIEKAILKSGLGLNPVTGQQTIRVPMPPLSEERRKEFIKIVKQEAEKTRIAIRNVRRDLHNDLKKQEALSEDEEHRIQDLIQKITDKSITLIDELLSEKEKDLLAI